MSGNETFAQDHRRYLNIFKKSWADAGKQLTVLGNLSRHHSETIRRDQTVVARATLSALQDLMPRLLVPKIGDEFSEYIRDFGQRWILFLDTLCQRGDANRVREREGFKPVLAFSYDMVVDGRKLERPVNYALVRIHPPAGTTPPRDDSRPWVIIDPRAGHGSGIGGFKSESEVGVALREGHPVYFVIFFPEPEPSQTLADICAAEATFLREVRARHPHSAKPLVTGNCQGGWAAMILGGHTPGPHGSNRDRGRAIVLLGGREGPQSVPLFRRRRRRRAPRSAHV